jgi:hypothetical protein
MKNKLVSRKELSAIISEKRGDEITIDQLRKNEKRWGLSLARHPDVNKRVVRFDLSVALRVLLSAGVLPREQQFSP